MPDFVIWGWHFQIILILPSRDLYRCEICKDIGVFCVKWFLKVITEEIHYQNSNRYPSNGYTNNIPYTPLPGRFLILHLIKAANKL